VVSRKDFTYAEATTGMPAATPACRMHLIHRFQAWRFLVSWLCEQQTSITAARKTRCNLRTCVVRDSRRAIWHTFHAFARPHCISAQRRMRVSREGAEAECRQARSLIPPSLILTLILTDPFVNPDPKTNPVELSRRRHLRNHGRPGGADAVLFDLAQRHAADRLRPGPGLDARQRHQQRQERQQHRRLPRCASAA